MGLLFGSSVMRPPSRSLTAANGKNGSKADISLFRVGDKCGERFDVLKGGHRLCRSAAMLPGVPIAFRGTRVGPAVHSAAALSGDGG